MHEDTAGIRIGDFQTARLKVQHWSATLRHLDRKEALLQDLQTLLTPLVLKGLPPTFALDDQPHAIADWVAARNAESEVYVVREIGTDILVGLLILVDVTVLRSMRVLHLGYLLGESGWGQGYATELVRGLVHKMSQAAPVTLIGGVAKGNVASARVLQKAGFCLEEDQSDAGVDTYACRIVPSSGSVAP